MKQSGLPAVVTKEQNNRPLAFCALKANGGQKCCIKSQIADHDVQKG